MNSRVNRINNVLLAAGAIEIAVGLLHFAMPHFAYQSHGLTLLQPDELSSVTLCVFSVGILLLAFGTLTVFLAFRVESAPEVVFFYVAVKAILWSARLVLELLYPVNIGLFCIQPFTVLALPGIAIELLLFAFSAVLIRKFTATRGVKR